MTLKEFLLARIAEDEAPVREALETDARFSSPDEGLTVQYLWARLIHHTSGRPVRQRRGSGLARGAPSPARVPAGCTAKGKIVTRHSGCGSGSGYCDGRGHEWQGPGMRRTGGSRCGLPRPPGLPE